MTWLKRSWRWAIFNLLASSLFLFIGTQGSTDWNGDSTFSTMLESGKWAIRLLLFCLTMTPLNTYFRWRSALNLRKSSGLWAFGFASLHLIVNLRQSQFSWLQFGMPSFITLGFLGFLILTALAVTSNRRAMKFLGKNWKRLHRSVYLAGIAVTSHAFLATSRSKILVIEPELVGELKLYLGVLFVLLVVRIPLVARLLKQLPLSLLKPRRAELSLEPKAVPDPLPKTLPIIYQREADVLFQDDVEDEEVIEVVGRTP